MSESPTPNNDLSTQPESRRRAGALRRFGKDKAAVASAAALGAVLFASLLAPWVLPQDPNETSGSLLVGPSAEFWFGTDDLGRDLFTRLVVGARSSLLVAFGAALLALVVGAPIGVLGGYLGRWVDATTMRLMDLLLALPILLVALVVVTVMGPSTINVIIAIAVASIPQFARLARATTLELRDRDFVVAQRAMGAGSGDIMVRTIGPNVVAPLVVQFVVTAAAAVSVAASLSFLGLGVPPPEPTWGGMLQDSQSFLYQSAWFGIFPGAALTITVLCLDRIGRGLTRAFGTSSDLSAGETTVTAGR